MVSNSVVMYKYAKIMLVVVVAILSRDYNMFILFLIESLLVT